MQITADRRHARRADGMVARSALACLFTTACTRRLAGTMGHGAGNIPIPEYEKLADTFTPAGRPAQWAALAKKAGMVYGDDFAAS